MRSTGPLEHQQTTLARRAADGRRPLTDAAGNLWLYGGYAYNATGTQGVTDDLWKYAPATGEWTWIGGSSTDFNATGVYGTRGVAAPNNEPGVRENATSWADAAGNLWLFGGDALSAGHDLWRYSPASDEWTWVSGSNTGNASGIYGTRGVAAAGNMSGARAQAVSWAEAAGNFWLFAGSDSNGNALNDLWKYNPASGEWTWVSGSSSPSAAGISGTQGSAAPANTPGARTAAISWNDGASNLWLFGGLGFDSNGGYSVLNDLWRYNPGSSQWTWVGGSTACMPSASMARRARLRQAMYLDRSNTWSRGPTRWGVSDCSAAMAMRRPAAAR